MALNLLLGFPMASTLLMPRFLVATNDQAMGVISQRWMGDGPGTARLIWQLHQHGEVNPAGSSLRGAMHSIWTNTCNGTRFQKCISGAHRVLIFGGKQMPGRDVVPLPQRPFVHGVILPPFSVGSTLFSLKFRVDRITDFGCS
jgi:hypothetical protein